MEQSPIQAFLHIGISNTPIYLERKLSLTTPGKAEEQSSVGGFESIFLKENSLQNPQATEVSHWICITELNVLKLLKIFWPRLRTGRCWCFYSLVFDLVNSYSKVIQSPLKSRKAWPTYCIEKPSHWKSIGYKDRHFYLFFDKLFNKTWKNLIKQKKLNPNQNKTNQHSIFTKDHAFCQIIKVICSIKCNFIILETRNNFYKIYRHTTICITNGSPSLFSIVWMQKVLPQEVLTKYWLFSALLSGNTSHSILNVKMLSGLVKK